MLFSIGQMGLSGLLTTGPWESHAVGLVGHPPNSICEAALEQPFLCCCPMPCVSVVGAVTGPGTRDPRSQDMSGGTLVGTWG